jgi:hypothetical protein
MKRYLYATSQLLHKVFVQQCRYKLTVRVTSCSGSLSNAALTEPLSQIMSEIKRWLQSNEKLSVCFAVSQPAPSPSSRRLIDSATINTGSGQFFINDVMARPTLQIASHIVNRLTFFI